MPRNVRLQRQQRAGAYIPTASMADIAFLLMIFFLCATSMNRDKGIGIQLPPPGQTKQVQKQNIANVWVNAEGKILIDLEQEVPLGKLRENIERRLQENKNLIVSLKADEETPYSTFVDVLDEIKLSGAERISLATPEK